MKEIEADDYLETNMKVVEKPHDKKRLCNWKQTFSNGDMKASLCLLPVLPATNTLVFKIDPLELMTKSVSATNQNKPQRILKPSDFYNLKEDKSAKEITGYSGDLRRLFVFVSAYLYRNYLLTYSIGVSSRLHAL